MNILKQLGLTQHESAVYLALLNHGTANMTEIAERAHLHRPATYHAMRDLVARGLVSETRRGKRRVYAAESPEQLRALVGRINDTLTTSLPSLMQAFQHGHAHPSVRMFDGPDGIRHAYEDMLATIKKGDVVYRYESPIDHSRTKQYKPSGYQKIICDDRIADWLIITNEKTLTKRANRMERIYKNIPREEDAFAFDISVFVYHDTVSFIDYGNETALLITGKQFAEFQRKIFTILFRRL